MSQNNPTTQVGQLVTESYDTVTVTYPSADTEVYTFRVGGLTGPTVAIVTVTYTDSGKQDLESVERT